MTTIDEHLEIASKYAGLSQGGQELDIRVKYAAIAQANALTAQAMDFHSFVEDWIVRGDLADAQRYDDIPEM